MDELIKSNKQTGPVLDMGSCDTCQWQGHLSECMVDIDQDGWENPVYIIHLCPNCSAGIIDSYWSSNESLKEWGIQCLKK